MKLYILERLFWEDIYLVGVFSSEEKAVEVMENHKYKDKHRFTINEVIIDEVTGD